MATAEYIGGLVFVAALIGVATLTPVGGVMSETVSYGMCRMAAVIDGTTTCLTPEQEQEAANAAVRPDRCDVVSTEYAGEAGIDVLVFDASTGVSYARIDRSDGTTTFTVVDSATVGAALEAGVEVQGGGASAEAIASAGGALAGEAGETWVVPTEEAEDFRNDLLRDQALDRGGGPFGGILSWGGEQIFGDIPDPDITYVAGGANVYAEAEAEVSVLDTPVAGGSAGVTGGVLIGTEQDRSDPDESKHTDTEYIQVDASVAGNLNLATAGIGGEIATQTVVKVKRNLDGDLVGLELVNSATGTAIGTLDDVLGANSPSLVAQENSSTVMTVDVPIDETTIAQAEAWLRGESGGDDFLDRIADTTKVSVEEREGEEFGLEFGAKVAFGLKLGGNVEGAYSTSEITDAVYLGAPDATGNRGFIPFEECLSAAG